MNAMYEIGTLVSYNKRGVYKVENVEVPLGSAKRLGQAGARCLKLAEKLACEEFAIALDTTPELIRERLYAVTERKASA